MATVLKQAHGAATPAGHDLATMLRVLREIIRRGLLTFKALPDPDARFLRDGRRYDVVHDAATAYGYAQAKVRDFQPTAHEIDQAMIVLEWLAWLAGREGREATRRLTGWAFGIPTWRLAQKENVGDKTIRRRIDRSVLAILNELIGTDFELVEVNEPYRQTPFAMVWDRPTHASTVRIQTVYVYGRGLMRNGKPWNDGHGKLRKIKRF